MPSKPKTTTYIVANPRGLPAGKWIVRDGAKRYFEGDTYEGTPPARFVEQGYVIASERFAASLVGGSPHE